MKLALKASNDTEKRVLDYLEANASEVLREKIGAGKKTLAGALKYAQEEAKKLAKGAGSLCVEDATVFGWVVHYFEEESLGEKAKTKPGVKLPGGVKVTAPVPKKPELKRVPVKAAADEKHLSMFEALFAKGRKA